MQKASEKGQTHVWMGCWQYGKSRSRWGSSSSPSSPSQSHTAMTNQYKVTTDDSKSTTSATSTCSLSPPTSDSNNVPVIYVVETWVTSRTVGFNWSVDLTKVQFELRDGVPGVSYHWEYSWLDSCHWQVQKGTTTATLCFTQVSSWSSPETEPVKESMYPSYNLDLDLVLALLGGVLSRHLLARHSIQDVKAHILICILRNADFFIHFKVTN